MSMVEAGMGASGDPETGSPVWWLHWLDDRLMARAGGIQRMERYYEGDHDLPEAPPDAAEAFARFLKMSRSNWMELVVDAAVERMGVTGFRLGDDPGADPEANRIWQANRMDAEQIPLYRTALVAGEAYTLVWPSPSDPTTPQIHVEHPLEAITEPDSTDPRTSAAGLKTWRDEPAGKRYATLYLPDFVWKFEAEDYRSAWHPRDNRYGGSVGWQPREVPGEPWPLPNPMGAVPLVPFRNKPSLAKVGVSELGRGVTDIQDRINKTLFDRIVGQEYAAFPQRWMSGVELPRDENGQPLFDTLKAAMSHIWNLQEDPDSPEGPKVGQFAAADLRPYIAGVEADIQHLAAITKTPPHYLLGSSGAFPSGESLKATETALVAKVREKMLTMGEAWEQTIRLAFLVQGDPEKAEITNSETIWRDPESRTLGELTDSLLKQKELGVPLQALWEQLYNQQEIARFEVMRRNEQAVMQALELSPFAGSARDLGLPQPEPVPPRNGAQPR